MKNVNKVVFCLFAMAILSFQINLNANSNETIERSVHWTSNDNGEQYAGLHILAEFWGVKPETIKNLDVENLLIEAAKKADAIPLEIVSHYFDPPNEDLPPGLTGAVILEESHITIHTWLEEDGYIAVDAFTCGPRAKPEKAIAYLKEKLQPTKVEIQEIKRGKKILKLKSQKKELTFKADATTGSIDITQILIEFLNEKEIEAPKPITITEKTTKQEINEWFENAKQYKKEVYKTNDKVFGEELTLDLYDCDHETICSKEKLKQYSNELCDLIDMKKFGEPFLEHFAEHSEFAAGYSLAQMIETSLISGHFSEFWNRAYINIFSCKTYDALKALNFTKEFFGAKSVKVSLNIR